MSKVEKIGATLSAVAALAAGVGAYEHNETRNDVRAVAASAQAKALDPVSKAELKNLEHVENIRTISLLGATILLGGLSAGAAMSARASGNSRRAKTSAAERS